MSVEALWIARFSDASRPQIIPGFSNAGIIVLESGRLFGGDVLYYYLGSYSLDGQKITAKATISHFNGPVADAFGTNRSSFDIILEGVFLGNKIEGTMHQIDNPTRRLKITLERKANLP